MLNEFKIDLKKQAIIIMGLPAAGKSWFIAHDLKNYFQISGDFNISNSDTQLKRIQYDMATNHYNYLKKKLSSVEDEHEGRKIIFDFKLRTKYINRGGETIIHPIELSWWEGNPSVKKFMSDFYRDYYAKIFILRTVSKEEAEKLFATKIKKSSNLIIIDTTSAANNMIPKLKKLKENNFMITVVYLDIDMKLSIERDIFRGGKEGRSVGDALIREYDKRMSESIKRYKEIAKQDKLVDRIIIFKYRQDEGLFRGEYELQSDTYYNLTDNKPEYEKQHKKNITGEGKMKLTKQYLQKLIREEYKKLMEAAEFYIRPNEVPQMIRSWAKQTLGSEPNEYEVRQGDKVRIGIPWHRADVTNFQFFDLLPNNQAKPVGNTIKRYDSDDWSYHAKNADGEIEVPSGKILVASGTYPKRITLYTASDAQLFLPDTAIADQLTDDEIVALWVAKSLKPAYRPKMKPEVYNSLIEKGLMKANRSITIDGRNALIDKKLKDRLSQIKKDYSARGIYLP